jgi:hypothetical protein
LTLRHESILCGPSFILHMNSADSAHRYTHEKDFAARVDQRIRLLELAEESKCLTEKGKEDLEELRRVHRDLIFIAGCMH